MALKLPNKIKMICRDSLIDINGEQVYECYPVNSDIESMVENGIRWAQRYKNSNYHVFEYDNKDFKNVKVISIDYRGEGGIAFKCIIEHDNKKFYVDIREEEILDIMINFGVNKGGILNTPCIFIQSNSQIKLAPMNSKLHLDAQESNSLRDLKIIAKKDLKVGHLYESLSGERGIYLGEYYIIDNYKGGDYFQGDSKKILWFYSLYNDEMEMNFNDKNFSFYRFITKKTSNYRKDLGKVLEINEDFFENYIYNVKLYVVDELQKQTNPYYYNYFYTYLNISPTKDFNKNNDVIDEVKVMAKLI